MKRAIGSRQREVFSAKANLLISQKLTGRAGNQDPGFTIYSKVENVFSARKTRLQDLDWVIIEIVWTSRTIKMIDLLDAFNIGYSTPYVMPMLKPNRFSPSR